MTECNRCLFDDSIAKMDSEGICEYCRLQEQLAKSAKPEEWYSVLNKVKEKGEGKQYDCLIGISGGEDSSVLLYLAVKVWKLRPLVIHFNNRTNREVANKNIRILIDHLNVNFIEYYLDNQEYTNLTYALLKAGVPDCDIANDVCMSKMMVTAAIDNGVKYIFNGHSFREEGSSPKAWSVIDYTYLNDIYKRHYGHDLVNYPLLTVWDQIKSAIYGLRKIYPFHYKDHDRQNIIKALKSIGWEDYGGKHNENIYTAFIGNYVLPKKFKIDKRRTYLSAQIREGRMTKFEAKDILEKPAQFNVNDLGNQKDYLLKLVNSYPIRPRSDYRMTNFKTLRPLFWVLMKLNAFPKTAYNKYCK